MSSRFRWPAAFRVAALAMGLGSCLDITGVDHDEARLVFIRDPSYDTLYVATPEDGSIEQRLALPMLASRLRISPKGDRLAIAAASGLWVMSLDRTGALQLATNARNVTWSPDGMRLAYVREPGPELRIVDATGGGDGAVPGAVPGGWLGLAWSPDGQRIAFEGMRDGARTIYVVNIDGTALIDLDLNLPGLAIRSSGEPTWSPDGRKLAFSRWVRNDGPNQETRLWVATLATGQAKPITAGGGTADVRPSWSSNGSEIAFLRFEGETADVFVVRADGTGLRQLTDTPASREEEPHWMRR